MKRLFRVPCLLLLLLAILISVSCAVDEHPQKLAAIVSAVAQADDSRFILDDPAGQMQAQVPVTDASGRAVYTFSVRIPDYTAPDFAAIAFDMPSVDLNRPDTDKYRADVLAAMRQACDAAASLHAPERYADAEVQIALTRTDHGYAAEILPESMEQLHARTDGMLNQVLDERMPQMDAFNLIAFAEKKNEFLSWILEDAGVVEAVQILDITVLSAGSYAVLLRYPDFTEVYSLLGERAYAACRAAVFDSVSIRLAGTETDAEAFMKLTQHESVITVRYQGGAAVPEDDGALWADWYAAKTAAEQETKLRIESKWLVTKMTLPKSGVLFGDNRGNSFLLRMPDNTDNPHCYAEFYPLDVVGEAIEKTPVLGVFIQSGGSAKCRLPAGRYQMTLHCGTKWYGPDYAFGAEDIRFVLSEPVTSENGNTNTVLLDLASDGLVAVN